MIKKNNSEKGLALQILIGLFFLVSAILLWLIMQPIFGKLSSVTKSNDGYFSEDAESLIEILDIVSTDGLLVIAVVMVVLYWIARAIYLSNTR
jgi:hypothetical protein